MDNKNNRQTGDFDSFVDPFIRLINEGFELWEGYYKTVDDVAKERLRNTQFEKLIPKFDKERTTDFTRKLIDLNMAYYKELINLSRNFFNTQSESTSRFTEQRATYRPTPEAKSVSNFELVGHPGDVLNATFVIENKKNSSAMISFEVSEFISEDQSETIQPTVDFEPSNFLLNPNEEIAVHLMLSITERFRENTTYRGKIGVKGMPGMEIQLKLDVIPKKAQSKSKSQPAKKSPTKKQSRNKPSSKK